MIYPSLCELCDLPKPDHLDGISFVSVLKNPASKVKEAAFVRFFDAESVITERYNYTERSDKDGTIKSNMLYDLKLDPKENNNISLKEENQELVKELSLLLSQEKPTKNYNYYEVKTHYTCRTGRIACHVMQSERKGS